MRAKNVIYFLSLIIVFSFFGYTRAGTTQMDIVTFHGVGVTIDLSFPSEAHPIDTITHSMTITATTNVDLQNITLVIYAPIDSALQQTNSSYLTGVYLLANHNLTTTPVRITLPQNTNGALCCLLHVETDQSSDYASFTFYTTQVRSLSYSELLALYNEALTNHGNLMTEYERLLDEYNGLLSENVFLISSQETLLNEYNEVKANYTSLLASHRTLQNNYAVSNASYGSLLTDYQTLERELGNLQGNYTSLQGMVSNLERTISESENAANSDRVVMLIFIIAIAGLIALVVYVKRKKQEPYLVIRKETVEVNKEENV